MNVVQWLSQQLLLGYCLAQKNLKNLPKERLSSIQFSSTHVLRVDSRSNDTLYEDFEKLWDLDSIGIREKDTVLEAFEKNVSFQDGKYSVHLPWKEHHKLLPDNYENSVARLNSQLRQLRRDPEVLREYNLIIDHRGSVAKWNY